MSNNYGISDAELNLIKMQASRRAELRNQFMKLRSDPWKNASEAGHVFDPAIQRFLSMKVTELDHFKPNMRTSLFGVCALVLPMFAYGYLLYNDRAKREAQIRSGELRYKDRLFKFA